MAVRGFRAKIAFNVAFLLLLSAVITDVLAVWVLQGGMVRSRLEHATHWLESVAGRSRLSPQDQPAGGSTGLHPFSSKCLPVEEFPGALILDAAGNQVFERNSDAWPPATLKAGALLALKTGKPQVSQVGRQWALFWWRPAGAVVSVPASTAGRRTAGAVAAAIPLSPLYARIAQYNKPVIFYILFNTLILTIAGLYRIFRIYLYPIDRIIRQADDFGVNEDDFFSFRREDNELYRLSSALNRMLKRISDDQLKLKASVASLEKANADLKRAQNDMVRAEKMASVGRLAAGIAHEIGNPIGIVLGYLELIRQTDVAPDERADFTRRAENEIQRIDTIIRQLLDLARPGEDKTQQTAVHAVIEEIVGVMAVQPMMTGIRIETGMAAQMDRLRLDAGQLRQVFLNLLLNAADAIRESDRATAGRIDITTENQAPEAPNDPLLLVIKFQDNGEGIPADQVENVFDPFYTTKAPGKGTGLGLAVSYMVVEKMGGTISIQSRLGQGTRFTITLPTEAFSRDTEPAGTDDP